MRGKYSVKCLAKGGKHARKRFGFKWKHYRKYLAATALALALIVGCGGTLMLLTDSTPTATNVMTAGDVEIGLYEKAGTMTDAKEITTDQDISIGTIRPGDEITKQPYVMNKGTTDAYIAVELIFWTTGTTTENDTEAKYEEFFGLGDENNGKGIIFNSNWKSGGDESQWLESTNVDGQDLKTFHTVYYYAKQTGGLTVLRSEDDQNTQNRDERKTYTNLFDSIKIPSNWSNEIDGVGFNLAIKAYAVQSDNVTLSNSTSAWFNFFKAQFPELEHDTSTPTP